MRTRGVSIASARYELFYKEVGEAAGRFVVRQMGPPDIGIRDTVSLNGELIHRHFETSLSWKDPASIGSGRDSQAMLTAAIQPLRSRPVNRLNPPRCLLEPAAESRRTRSVMIELERSGRRAGFSTTRIVAFRDITIANCAALLPRPGGASQREREAAEAGQESSQHATASQVTRGDRARLPALRDRPETLAHWPSNADRN